MVLKSDAGIQVDCPIAMQDGRWNLVRHGSCLFLLGVYNLCFVDASIGEAQVGDGDIASHDEIATVKPGRGDIIHQEEVKREERKCRRLNETFKYERPGKHNIACFHPGPLRPSPMSNNRPHVSPRFVQHQLEDSIHPYAGTGWIGVSSLSPDLEVPGQPRVEPWSQSVVTESSIILFSFEPFTVNRSICSKSGH
jgi:hypothetical protein